ncbi:carbohydrate-binding module family 13 protein, partial [Macrolepiota fuliginosa MF-IS2]
VRSGQRYKITNVKNTDQVLDLSGMDSRPIIGWEPHGGNNQQWDLHQESQGWTLRSASTGVYVSVEGHQGGHNDYLKDGTRVIGTQEPYKWHIWHEPNNKFRYLRVSVQNARKSLDLSSRGQTFDFVEVWGKSDGESQLWYFD